MGIRKAHWLFLVPLFFCPLPISAQEARSTILGRVTDQTGGVIAGANVEAANADTGVRSTALTNASGDFLLPFLIPGHYTVTVEAPGFKRSLRPQVQARINDRITIDVSLEVGQATESVQVTAETPLLDTSTTSMGQVLNTRTVLELPLLAGNVAPMAALVPGVLFMPTFPKDVRPFDTGSTSRIAGDGSRVGTAQFTLDGAPNMHDAEVAYSPPPGVVQEVKVQAATFDASYGYFTGTSVNMSLKSGANQVHGQGYYFNQNPLFYANRFFLNRVGTPKIAFKSHRWGGNLSGPVTIPKVYDGRNRTFWMYGYEGMRSFDPVSIGFESVPTAAQRSGDFSGLLAQGTRNPVIGQWPPVASSAGSHWPITGFRKARSTRPPRRSWRSTICRTCPATPTG
jgi:Carboxypeptidase regulatory-like domain